MQIFASSYDWHISWPRPDIEYNWSLYPWNKKMCSFTNNILFNTGESIENNCTMSTVNCFFVFGKVEYFKRIMSGWWNFSIYDDNPMDNGYIPLYNADWTTLPAKAIPKPIPPILFRNCAIFSNLLHGLRKFFQNNTDFTLINYFHNNGNYFMKVMFMPDLNTFWSIYLFSWKMNLVL